jgi:hypothetical protein
MTPHPDDTLTALDALDRGDVQRVRLLFAPGAPHPDAAIKRIMLRWSVGVRSQPDLITFVGLYTTRTHLDPSLIGALDSIPVRYQSIAGDALVRLVLQNTDSGWSPDDSSR